MADRKITDLTALTTPASADVLPIVDVSEAAAADKNKKVTVGELFKGIPDGTAAAPAIAFESDDGNGFFLSTTDTIGIATNGVSRATVSTTAVTSTLPVIVPDGSAAAPSVAFTGSGTDTGLYSPGADQVAISTNGTGRLFVDASGNVGVNAASPAGRLGVDGSVVIGNQLSTGTTTGTLRVVQSTSSVYLQAGLNTTTGSSGALVFSNINASNEWMRITSAGQVGIGTSSPAYPVHVSNNAATFDRVLQLSSSNTATLIGFGTSGGSGELAPEIGASGTGLQFNTQNTPRMTIAAGGNVGIGTTSPLVTLQVQDGASNCLIRTISSPSSIAGIDFGDTDDNDIGGVRYDNSVDALLWRTNNAERARIDSSGRLLVGTSSNRGNWFNSSSWGGPLIQLESTSSTDSAYSVTNSANNANAPLILLGKNRSGTIGGNTVVQSGDSCGQISFFGNDGTQMVEAARIDVAVDSTPGADDMPGRLVFSTTADGASSPTERMRIANDGAVVIGKTSVDDTTAGFAWRASQYFSAVRSGGALGYINRLTNDGALLEFAQDSVTEGTISVSGTTVSYNGAHLSRWSQLPSGAERTEILRGTVLSNIDEMCEWGDEDNEQLNRMKVSDVEGDKNVSGVFQAWDDDDDTYTNDFYCAMTGDFIIRIGAGVTVERGDLLMSAGDGTAKPQDDDIIRSKTIAKVTSTNVSCTYDDGSYCVPCVLMAC